MPQERKRKADSADTEDQLGEFQDLLTAFSQDIISKTIESNENNTSTNKDFQANVLSKLDRIINLLEKLSSNAHTTYQRMDDEMELTTQTPQNMEEMSKLKELCNIRKHVFFSQLRNNSLKQIYNNNLHNEHEIKVPHKFRVKINNTDRPEIIQSKKKLCLAKVENEIEKLTVLESFDTQKLKDIEEQAEAIILSVQLNDNLRKLWNDTNEAEERKSKELWEPKNLFLMSDKHLSNIDALHTHITPMVRMPYTYAAVVKHNRSEQSNYATHRRNDTQHNNATRRGNTYQGNKHYFEGRENNNHSYNHQQRNNFRVTLDEQESHDRRIQPLFPTSQQPQTQYRQQFTRFFHPKQMSTKMKT